MIDPDERTWVLSKYITNPNNDIGVIIAVIPQYNIGLVSLRMIR